jgi:hypothetical protein
VSLATEDHQQVHPPVMVDMFKFVVVNWLEFVHRFIYVYEFVMDS